MLKKRSFILLEYLVWILIGVAVLFLAIIIVYVLSDKNTSGIDFIKDVFRFGR